MDDVTRRSFARNTIAGVASVLTGGRPMSAKAARMTGHRARSLRVTEISAHEILLPYHRFNETTLFRYHGLGIQLRTVYVVRTNQGIEGYGENWGRKLPAHVVQQYVDTNPFDWIGDKKNLPINMAMYDIMGKHLDLPVWKLIGPKVRDRLPVCGWTVSQQPNQMANEVRHAASQGYRWLKYHVDEVQNVVDQTKAMQAVAPDGFKVHYDFNANSTFEAVAPIIKKLEQFPIAGRVEDPIVAADPEGWRKIRDMTSLPIYVHHGPTQFMIDGLVDGLVAGHAPIGMASQTAAIAEATNTPIMLQQAGGTINQAFLAHEAAVFKMATIDHCNLAELWADDITHESMPIVDGCVRLPDGPGLGVTLNFEKVAQYEAAPRPTHKKFLVRISYRGGPTVFTRHDPERPGAADNMRYLNRLLGDRIPGPSPAYDNDVITDFWDDLESPFFHELWNETQTRFVVQ